MLSNFQNFVSVHAQFNSCRAAAVLKKWKQCTSSTTQTGGESKGKKWKMKWRLGLYMEVTRVD